MVVMVRSDTGWLRRSATFTCSAGLHAFALAWITVAPAFQAPAPSKSLYDREIRPNERRIVWYHLKERLPDVAPTEAGKARPPRARVKAAQTLVAGARDNARPPQLIWTPAPEIEVPKPVPLPNVVAVRQSKVLRPFTPPPEAHQTVAKVVLPDAPRLASAAAPKLPVAAPLPRPQARAFTPPPSARPRVAAPALPDAPEIRTGGATNMVRIPRAFSPPPGRRAPAAANVPAEAAPALNTAAPATEASLAIVGLNPAKAMEFITPPGSRQAGFSAGPQSRAERNANPPGANENAMIVVPGLLAQGAKDDQPTLVAGLGPATRRSLVEAARPGRPAAPLVLSTMTRATKAPDPILEGRIVYTVAIQMPNVTSYSGSWVVWFAERHQLPGGSTVEMRPPVPLRKVDPKYIASAQEDRVEGTVRLSGIIRSDGRMDMVTVLRRLDDRLDRSAQEALIKWAFEPALRNGVPVDVDAVFEIPFHLAPRPKR